MFARPLLMVTALASLSALFASMALADPIEWSEFLVSRTGQDFAVGSVEGDVTGPRKNGLQFQDQTTLDAYLTSRTTLRDEVSESEAQALFDWLAAEGRLAISFPDSGCEARAQYMSVLLELKGVRASKVFVESPQQFSVPNEWQPWLKNNRMSWGFHVAPVVKVQGDWKVLDPTMLKGPATIADWRSRIAAPSQNCPVVEPAKAAKLDVAAKKGSSAKSCFTYVTSRFFYSPFEHETSDAWKKALAAKDYDEAKFERAASTLSDNLFSLQKRDGWKDSERTRSDDRFDCREAGVSSAKALSLSASLSTSYYFRRGNDFFVESKGDVVLKKGDAVLATIPGADWEYGEMEGQIWVGTTDSSGKKTELQLEAMYATTDPTGTITRLRVRSAGGKTVLSRDGVELVCH